MDGRTDGRDMKTAAAVSSMHSHLRTSMFLLPVFSTSQTPDSQNTLLLLLLFYYQKCTSKVKFIPPFTNLLDRKGFLFFLVFWVVFFLLL